MTLAQFTARIRDDASRFRVHYERAIKLHPQLLDDDMPLDQWLALLVLFAEQETARPTRRG